MKQKVYHLCQLLLAGLIALTGIVAVAPSARAAPAAWGLTITPISYNFGPAAVNKLSATHSFVATNTSGYWIDMMGSSILTANRGSPEYDPNFTIVNDGCTGGLDPGLSCTVDVAFFPQSAGGKSAFLYITGSIPDGPLVYEFAEVTGLGRYPYEVTTVAVEAVGKTKDPISTSVGEYHFAVNLFDLGGPLSLYLNLYYASWMRTGKLGKHNDPFGGDFDHNYHTVLVQSSPSTVTVQYGPGDLIDFVDSGSGWEVVDEEVLYQLKEDDVGTGYFYLMDPMEGRVYTFEKDPVRGVAHLIRIGDRNGNTLSFTNDGKGRILQVEDGLGRSLTFTYTVTLPWVQPQLTQVHDQAGRTVEFDYADTGGNLLAMTDAMGMVTVFSFTGYITDGAVAGVTLPKGNVPVQQSYERDPSDTAWRATSQTDAYGNVTTLDYDDAQAKTTVTEPSGGSYEHTHKDQRALTEWSDQAGKSATIGYDDQDRPMTMTDRLGDTTWVTYHPESGRIASLTDAAGNTFAYVHTAQSQTFTNPDNGQDVTFSFYNLTGITYPDGSTVEMAYDDQGNVTTFTNRAGKSWTMTYNSRGQPLTITEPTGGVTTYTYNPDGTTATRTDSDTGVTSYLYDAYKRRRRIVRPDGSFVRMTYDLNGRLLSVTNERGGTCSFTYDGNGNLVALEDPLGNTITYTQDLMDRLSEHFDPFGHSSRYEYDAMGRVAAFTDRHNYTSYYTYDDHGWLTGFVDTAGYSWTTAYDSEGIPVADTSPMGRTTTYESDELGHIVRLTDPMGRSMRFRYDELGQVTAYTDRVGRSTFYNYDDGGYLVGVTESLLGSVTYQRDDRGMLTRITDLRGNDWDFVYSPMGRLTSHSDPLNNTWTHTHDDRGRLDLTTFPDGGTLDYTYDAQSNVVQAAFSDGPTLDYGYDAIGQLVSTNHVTLTYDARGDIVESQDGAASFGATYDAGRWLRTVSYDGQAVVTYTYDVRGLLTQVEDDLTGAWLELSYNADRELVEVRRSNGISTTFTYDAAGAVIRIQDGSLADQQYTLSAEGEVLRMERTLPLDIVPTPKFTNLTYDEANQIASAGYSYDSRGRQTAAPGLGSGDPAARLYTWDGANELTEIVSGTTTASFTYNGLGDLRSRTVDGTTTTYYHNYALGLSPIVAEEEGGAYKRFYVYAPGGALLYTIDVATGDVRFYHFDRLGTTLFMTDDVGSVSDAYAYDTYGDLLGHTGTSDQPFTFIGRYGVRWEQVGGLYHMRARYYDPVTTRFLSRDPDWPNILDPEELNPYAYTNDPLQEIDPMGRGKLSVGSIANTGTKVNKILSKLKTAGKVGKNSAKGTSTAMTKNPGDLHPVEAATVGLISQVPGSAEILDTLDTTVFGDEPFTAEDAEYIAGGAARDVLASPATVTKFVSETILDIAWVMSDRDMYDKPSFWRLYFLELRESEILKTMIEVSEAIEEVVTWIGEEAANVYHKTLLVASWTGEEAGNNLGTLMYGDNADNARQVKKNAQSKNPVIAAGHAIGTWFGNWWYGIK